MASKDLHYTAKLYFNGKIIYIKQDNNLDRLIVDLSELLEDEYRHAEGQIIDNQSGKIVHRCRMAASD